MQTIITNVAKIMKLVRKTCKDTKLCFSLLICRADLKGIEEKAIKTNTHLKNYCKQQNLDFIDSSNKEISSLSSRRSKLAKNFLDHLYWVYAIGNSFPDQFEQSKICIIKKPRNDKLSHFKCVSLWYLNINSIRNKFSSIPHWIDNNLDIFPIPEAKPFRLDVTRKKVGLLVFVNNVILPNIFEVSIFLET